MNQQRSRAIPLHEAADAAPTLARLVQLARESGERLKAIQSFIPPALRAAVRPGPIDGTTWCLLVDNSATAAKLRQVLPVLQDQLGRRGWQVTAIRLKLEAQGK